MPEARYVVHHSKIGLLGYALTINFKIPGFLRRSTGQAMFVYNLISGIFPNPLSYMLLIISVLLIYSGYISYSREHDEVHTHSEHELPSHAKNHMQKFFQKKDTGNKIEGVKMGILDRSFGKKTAKEDERVSMSFTEKNNMIKMKSSEFAEKVRMATSMGITLLNNPLFDKMVTCDKCGETVDPKGSIKPVPDTSPTGGGIDLQCPFCGSLWVTLRSLGK